jgi:hypothetical protein
MQARVYSIDGGSSRKKVSGLFSMANGIALWPPLQENKPDTFFEQISGSAHFAGK